MIKAWFKMGIIAIVLVLFAITFSLFLICIYSYVTVLLGGSFG
jgi:hypothetical protein